MSFDYKLARLAAGAPPRVLDLFAGCGGLSLGFKSAGFEIAAAVEYDPDAAASHGLNFHPGQPNHSAAIDITRTEPRTLADDLQLGSVERAVDVIVGGPPCQAYARVGRSKLREIQDHPEAYLHDPRANLFKRYLDYVDAFQPLALLMENVPDVLNQGGRNIAEEVADALDSKGYVVGYTLLNAAFYGVPQMRERMFLVAYRRELGATVKFPEPSHWIDLPQGYLSTRQVALQSLSGRLANGERHFYVPPPLPHRELASAVTASEALSDLPVIMALRDGTLKRGARRFDVPVQYLSPPAVGTYAEQMRAWSGYAAPAEGVSDHVIRYLPRDWKLFARMKPGDQYPEAHSEAVRMFEEELQRRRSDGRSIRAGSREYEELRASFVPPYDPGKFPNKWRKMEADRPARTLMAHLGKDSYSHIHYDSIQARTISVREAARLQSFPDGFRFSGTMNPAFRQIGNAVPPLMAKRLAEKMLESIRVGASSTRGTRQAA
jgi:DNA (cytosine-5)-methyltransferase 1